MDYRITVLRDVQLLPKGFLKNSNHLLLELPYKIDFANGILNLQINNIFACVKEYPSRKA
jgi:hypothetical protein